jgi:hypothetical protein
MSDALWAARLGDALNHTSMMADILGGVLEVAGSFLDQRRANLALQHLVPPVATTLRSRLPT